MFRRIFSTATHLVRYQQQPTAHVRSSLAKRRLSSFHANDSIRRPVRTEHSFAHFQHRFDTWRREHALFLLVTGGLLGAGTMLGLTYVFILDNPKAIEKLVVSRTANAFSKALTFDARKKLYFGLPDVALPVGSATEMMSKTTANTESKENPVKKWADTVSFVLDEAGSSFMLMAKTLMRRELVHEACQFPDFHERLSALTEILPYPSIERDILIGEQLEARLAEKGWIEASLLEEHPPSTVQPTPTCDPLTKILITSMAFFPGPANRLIQYLDTADVPNAEPPFSTRLARRASALFTSEEEKIPLDEATKTDHVFFELRNMYRNVLDHPKMRDYVLQTALSMTIDAIYNMKLKKPYDAYVQAINDDLLGPLRRDARVTEDILDQVKRIFLAAPAEIQARILLTALRHPFAKNDDATPDEQAKVVRDLLSSGGVVAVKLAQMLAEDPKIPINYRTLLGELRDDNEPMSVSEFYHAIPQTVRQRIVMLGPCLGVGSVKQVHRCKFEDGSESAVAVLRKNVEDEALSSLNALEASQELGVVAKRLGRLVFGEFNLFSEGEALGDFATTRIGRHPKFRVVSVVHHSPKCLIEEIATGPTLAKALSVSTATEFDQTQVKKLLTEYHRAVFSAFIFDGMIHSDIHLGNAVLERRKPATDQDDGLGLVLFDVGQWEKIGQADTKALLWVLGSISSVDRRKSLREAALTSLQSVSHFSNVERRSLPPENDPELRAAIEASYSEAIAPFEDGTLPDQRQAYMLFLRACEKNGVSLPKGAFSVAKMIDGMLSQKQQFRLHDVAEEMMEAFLRKNMSWWEASSVLKGTISTSLKLA